MIINYESWLDHNEFELDDIFDNSNFYKIRDIEFIIELCKKRIEVLNKWENQKEKNNVH